MSVVDRGVSCRVTISEPWVPVAQELDLEGLNVLVSSICHGGREQKPFARKVRVLAACVRSDRQGSDVAHRYRERGATVENGCSVPSNCGAVGSG